jgi:hypothetical protein
MTTFSCWVDFLIDLSNNSQQDEFVIVCVFVLHRSGAVGEVDNPCDCQCLLFVLHRSGAVGEVDDPCDCQCLLFVL